ncbi:hypothetical protein HK405_001967 [Cladochytrium tenue]|nr:hypothetical protein HK405_001967 [Cladochytrium tenue]
MSQQPQLQQQPQPQPQQQQQVQQPPLQQPQLLLQQAAQFHPLIAHQRPPSSLQHNMQCYNCGTWFMMCPCEGLGNGEDLQFVLREADLPPPPATSPAGPASAAGVQRHMEFWGELTGIHPRGNRMDAAQFVADAVRRGLVQAMASHRALMERVWADFKADKSQIKEVKRRWKNVWSVPQLKAVGDEVMDSYFTGRWYELHIFGMTLLVQALNFSELQPESQPELRMMAESIAFVSEVVKNISVKPGFTLVAPASYPRLRHMTVFTPLLEFH